jgi:hypothetical protein
MVWFLSVQFLKAAGGPADLPLCFRLVLNLFSASAFARQPQSFSFFNAMPFSVEFPSLF